MKFLSFLLLLPLSLQAQDARPFGVCAHLQGGSEHAALPHNVEMMERAGIQSIRADFSWGSVSWADGKWNYSRQDRVVEEAERAGCELLIPLVYSVKWADPAYRHLDKWGEYVDKTVSRYKDRIRYWEVWNEPNLKWDKPNPGEYATLLRESYKRIKAIDPKLTVVYGGLSLIPFDYLEATLKAGAGKCCDVMNIHPYRERMNTMGAFEAYAADIDSVRRMMTRYGIGGMPLWSTEMGWPTALSVGEETKDLFKIECARIAAKEKNAIFAVVYDEKDIPDPRFSRSQLRSWFAESDSVEFLSVDDCRRRDLNQYALVLAPKLVKMANPAAVIELMPKFGQYMAEGNLVFYAHLTYSKQEQARWLPETFLLSLRMGIDRCYWYEFMSPEYSRFDNEQQFGLVAPDLTPYPAYFTYSALTELFTEGATVDKSLPWNCGRYAQVRFVRRDGSSVLALWSPEGKMKVALPKTRGLHRAADQYGRDIRLDANAAEVEIGPDIIYLEYKGRKK